jgi:hypothetical protein
MHCLDLRATKGSLTETAIQLILRGSSEISDDAKVGAQGG